KYCKGPDGKACRDLGELEDVMAKSRNYDELLDVWTGWHAIARPMRAMYERLVGLANEGSREVGFADTGAVWRSAYDMPPEAFDNDLRIKMCIKIDEDNLITIHHELGHDYYFHYYYKMPVLFQQGANDGFHEAIGDALTLSITPAYLKKLNLIQTVPSDQKGLI